VGYAGKNNKEKINSFFLLIHKVSFCVNDTLFL
jgi:hypothetical protein